MTYIDGIDHTRFHVDSWQKIISRRKLYTCNVFYDNLSAAQLYNLQLFRILTPNMSDNPTMTKNVIIAK